MEKVVQRSLRNRLPLRTFYKTILVSVKTQVTRRDANGSATNGAYISLLKPGAAGDLQTRQYSEQKLWKKPWRSCEGIWIQFRQIVPAIQCLEKRYNSGRQVSFMKTLSECCHIQNVKRTGSTHSSLNLDNPLTCREVHLKAATYQFNLYRACFH